MKISHGVVLGAQVLVIGAVGLGLSGCAGGMASAVAQSVASKSITNAQQKSADKKRMKKVMAMAEANSRLPGDDALTCDEISADLIQQAESMASSAEDLGIDVNDFSKETAMLTATSQAAMATGVASVVPGVSVVSGMAAQEMTRQRIEARDAAEVEFYSAKARRDVLLEYSDAKNCATS